jgi:bifunctional non-homologous end joining protein LigD
MPAPKSGGKKPGKKPTAPRKTPAKRAAKAPMRAPAEATEFRITHPDRVLYPDVGITKADLAAYYLLVSEWMLPHVVNRPLTLVRCPEGMSGPCFYQKHPAIGMPATLERIQIQERDGMATYLTLHDLAGLIALVQFGALEIHTWGSQSDDVNRPDRIVFDLDPDVELGWPHVKASAVSLREMLADMKLESFLKTTGGKGLHVVVPLERKHTWPEVKQFSRAVAERLTADSPDKYTTNMSKAKRGGKIFVDYLRNEDGSTSVVAYSTRARAGAPVSCPIEWSELKSLTTPQKFTVTNMPQRLKRLKKDPWQDIAKVRQSITAAAKKRVGLR